MDDEPRDLWNSIAEDYTNLIANRGTPHHRDILNPCVSQLLGDVKGKKLLDAGCGEGYLARHYAQKGAVVTGLDISSILVEKADGISKKAGIDVSFQIGDICNLNDIGNSSFDLVLCNLVLLNIPCFTEALMEFDRILNDDGILVFSIVHPAFNFYGPGKWEMGEKNPKSHRQEGLFFKVDNYFNEREFQHYWRTREGVKFAKPIIFYHRTLSSYFEGIHNAGFRLVSFKEPLPVTDSEFFQRERRIPFFAVFKVKKSSCKD
jgi:2-polyprenyl-3-methyl-5-hydroxy-6-metoxy-1,4-benzoquinol methylase